MAKGTTIKPDFIKAGQPVPKDTLSAADKGVDFVKPNEKAQGSNSEHKEGK